MKLFARQKFNVLQVALELRSPDTSQTQTCHQLCYWKNHRLKRCHCLFSRDWMRRPGPSLHTRRWNPPLKQLRRSDKCVEHHKYRIDTKYSCIHRPLRTCRSYVTTNKVSSTSFFPSTTKPSFSRCVLAGRGSEQLRAENACKASYCVVSVG